jgi:hypothetical protein
MPTRRHLALHRLGRLDVDHVGEEIGLAVLATEVLDGRLVPLATVGRLAVETEGRGEWRGALGRKRARMGYPADNVVVVG